MVSVGGHLAGVVSLLSVASRDGYSSQQLFNSPDMICQAGSHSRCPGIPAALRIIADLKAQGFERADQVVNDVSQTAAARCISRALE